MPAKGQRSGVYVKCDNCGKMVYKNKSWAERPHLHNYCSNKCQREWSHKEASTDRACEQCGRIFTVRRSLPNRFCSTKCQNEWQRGNVGEKNAKYKRIKKLCDWCGKEFDLRAYKENQQSNFFCCTDCRRQWYATVFSQREEWKEASRIRAAKLCHDGTASKTETKPQIIVNSLLDELGVEYEREYNLRYYSADNYLSDSGLIIEVMGDFWHCNPTIYDSIRYKKQNKTVSRDKAKRTYVRRYRETEILYLWESDIYDRPELCKKLIEEYIKNAGILQNYQSFNYCFYNGCIRLQDEIVQSYFEKDTMAELTS